MKQALIFWGGWEGHEPRACVARFETALEQHGFDLTILNSTEILSDEKRMRQFDLVIPCWTMGHLEEKEERGLLQAVQQGAGIAGWHGGMGDAFRSNTDYQFMTGGQFVAHPGDITEYTVHISRPEDPLLDGIRDFRMHSEKYYMHVDPSNEVLAHIIFPEVEACPGSGAVKMPAVWKRMYGKGRVFYSSLGHAAADFDVYECFEIMKRGMIWASR